MITGSGIWVAAFAGTTAIGVMARDPINRGEAVTSETLLLSGGYSSSTVAKSAGRMTSSTSQSSE